MHNFKLNKIVAIVFAMALFSSMVFSISILPAIKQVQGTEGSGPWLDGWDYRKSHTICNATGAGTNYQVKINVEYGNGADSGDTVYLNGLCRSDFGDIRFTDSNASLLDYWMENKNDSNNAVFWVEVAEDLSSSHVTIFIYYGNSEATYADDFSDVQHGENTFLLFDNFDDSSIDSSKWDIQNDVNESDGIVTISASGAYTSFLRSDDTYLYNVATRVKCKADNVQILTFGFRTATSPYDSVVVYRDTSNPFCYLTENDATRTQTAASIDSNYHVYDFCWTDDSTKYYQDDSLTATHATNIPNESLHCRHAVNSNGAAIYLDWVFVRNYVDNEPSHGSWGSEESLVSSASWLEGWNYRKSHVVTGSTAANLTDYIFGFKVYKGSGTDGTETYGSTVFGKVYCDNHCRDDFLDVRFTDSDGTSMLDLNLMEVNSGNYAYIWVKISVDAYPANKTIYMYYDNGESTEVSMPEEEFFTEIGHGRTQQGDATLSSANSYDAFPESARATVAHNSKSVYWYVNHAMGFEGRLTVLYRYGGISATKRGETPDFSVGPGFTRVGDMFDNSSFEINMTAGWIMGFWRPSGVSATVQRYLPSGSTTFIRSGYLPVGSSDGFSSNYNYGYWTATVGYRPVVGPEPTHTSWGEEEEWQGSQSSGGAEGWLDGWNYRKSHVITGSIAGNVTDYIFGFKVYKGSGTDGTETIGNTRFGKVYCDNHCRDDFLDVRFTDDDGNTTLDMNLMEVNSGNYSYIWIKTSVDMYPTTKTIYIYYDNGESTEASIDEDDFFVELGHGRIQQGSYPYGGDGVDIYPSSASATAGSDCKTVYWYCNVASNFTGRFTVLSGTSALRTKQAETPIFSAGSGLTRVGDIFDDQNYALTVNSGWLFGYYKSGGSNIPSAWVSSTSFYYPDGYLPAYSTGTFQVNYNFGYWTALAGCRNVVNPEPAHTSWGEEVEVMTSSEESWLGWTYRKSHVITGSSYGNLTDYIFGFKVYKGSGTDGTETLGNTRFGKIYCGGNCRDDFRDIRFTDSDGNTTLDMNIMNISSGNYAYIWVKVSVDAPATKTIYVYYDNVNATTDLSIAEDEFFEEIGHGNTQQGDRTSQANNYDRYPWSAKVTVANNSKSVYWYCNVASSFTGRLTVLSGDGNTMIKRGETPEFSVGSGLTRVADMFDDVGYEIEMNSGWIMGHYKIGGNNSPSVAITSQSRYREGHLLPTATGTFSVDYNFGYWTALVGYRVVVDPEPTHTSWGDEESSCWLPYMSS